MFMVTYLAYHSHLLSNLRLSPPQYVSADVPSASLGVDLETMSHPTINPRHSMNGWQDTRKVLR
jgi:hypothetical protein